MILRAGELLIPQETAALRHAKENRPTMQLPFLPGLHQPWSFGLSHPFGSNKSNTVTLPLRKYSMSIKKTNEPTHLLLVSPVRDKSLMVQGTRWVWEKMTAMPESSCLSPQGETSLPASGHCGD